MLYELHGIFDWVGLLAHDAGKCVIIDVWDGYILLIENEEMCPMELTVTKCRNCVFRS